MGKKGRGEDKEKKNPQKTRPQTNKTPYTKSHNNFLRIMNYLVCKKKKYNEKILVLSCTGINIELSCYFTVKQDRLKMVIDNQHVVLSMYKRHTLIFLLFSVKRQNPL